MAFRLFRSLLAWEVLGALLIVCVASGYFLMATNPQHLLQVRQDEERSSEAALIANGCLRSTNDRRHLINGIVTATSDTGVTMKITVAATHGDSVTVFFGSDASIRDDAGKQLAFRDLQSGNFISVSSDCLFTLSEKGTLPYSATSDSYQAVEVVRHARECTMEGETDMGDRECCAGLTKLRDSLCTKCGDGICTSPENGALCPLDCTKVGEVINLSVSVKAGSLNDGMFLGTSTVGEKALRILTTKDTVYSRTSDGKKERMHREDFQSGYSDFAEIHWPIFVHGVLEEQGSIRADEVNWGLQ